MLLLTDEDFNEDIARAVRRDPAHLVESVRQHAPTGIPDKQVLALALQLSAVLATHDISTMVPLVTIQVAAGMETPRVILVVKHTAPARAAEDIRIALGASLPSDWDGGVIYVPL